MIDDETLLRAQKYVLEMLIETIVVTLPAEGADSLRDACIMRIEQALQDDGALPDFVADGLATLVRALFVKAWAEQAGEPDRLQ